MHLYRTHTCGELRKEHQGSQVKLSGWVHRKRDHGQLLFIDLRDHYGLMQCVFDCNSPIFKAAESLKNESVITVIGKIVEREAETINSKMPTGEVELLVEDLIVQSHADMLPIQVNSQAEFPEDTRLTYRFLDLRREKLHENIMLRSNVIQSLRRRMVEQNFTEFQTPILTASSPEGARDFLVPSRMHPGHFYALPQAPQQFKQLLMVAGFDRYFQIAPCFRDEDARADRSPGEFYQLDIEMSFVTQDDILNLVENMFTTLVKEIFPNKKITQEPWPRIKHSDAIAKYGSDKPDLRKDKNDPNELAFTWVVDFPLFVQQTKEDFFYGAGEKYAPSHHMFTAPREEDIPLLDTSPLKAKSYQHDLALNGYEVGGGSVRIHNPKLQEKIFGLIGFTEKQKEQFAHLLEAFEYGAPPHGGIAPGIDRLLMVLTGQPSLKEMIAFPLTGDAKDPLMDAPSFVTEQQLKDVHIKIREEDLPK